MNNLMSEQIDQIATALCKAQGEMDVAHKNQKNPFFKSTYADFEAIVNASRPALVKHGLSVIQSILVQEDHNSYLITQLTHNSGQWFRSIAKHNPPKQDIQSLSSYNTYLKRMCYTSLIGVVTSDEDDDGNAASKSTQDTREVYASPPIEKISKDQCEQLCDILQYHPDVLQSVLKGLDIDSLEDMPKNKFLSSFKRIQEIIATK